MTIGEKIQFYRRKNSLSQEELGQKMLVSRQTVSLWEMDKTMPSVDNLIRLKEIFSISIDEILSESEPIDESVVKPKESYVFKYEKTELIKLFRNSCVQPIKRAVIFTIACAFLFVILAAMKADMIFIGLITGYFLTGIISHLKGYFTLRKGWKKTENKILECTYFYDIYEGYFTLNISRNEEITKTQKIYFDDIEDIRHFENFLVLQFSGQGYIIKKDALISDSAFITIRKNEPVKVEFKKPRGVLKAISILLFILSICSAWATMISIAIFSNVSQAMTSENMWIFFLFLPIPISSILFGFNLKKKGYKYKKNVIVGFIIASILCVYGSFAFLFSNVYTHSNEPILVAEQTLNIDIPTHSSINTQDWTQGTQSVSRGYVYSVSDVFFNDDAVENFEIGLSADAKWITDIPSDMVGISSHFCDYLSSDYNYYMLYNRTTKEFNKLPSESGTYEFINVIYNVKSNTMKLVEYQIEYTK